MFGRKNWEQLARDLDSPKKEVGKKFEDDKTILENMSRHRGRTLVGSLVLSTFLNFGSLGKIGSLEGNWVKDKYAKRIKHDAKGDSDPLIRVEDSKSIGDKEKTLEKETEVKMESKDNEFTSVEDAEKNPNALIKVDKDNPLEGLKELSLEDRARVDIATFDFRREYHMGELSLADLEDREKTFDEVVDWFIENTKKGDRDRIDFEKLFSEIVKPTLPEFSESKYDAGASRLSQVFNRENSRADCEGTMLTQLAILQRLLNYDKNLQENFQIYVAQVAPDETGVGHASALIFVKNTGKYLILERNSLSVLTDDYKKYLEAYPISSLISGALGEKSIGIFHNQEEKEGEEKAKITIDDVLAKQANDDKTPENVLTRVKSDTVLPVYPGKSDSSVIIDYEKREDIEIELPVEVKDAVSEESILGPEVYDFLQGIDEYHGELNYEDFAYTKFTDLAYGNPALFEQIYQVRPDLANLYLNKEIIKAKENYNLELKTKLGFESDTKGDIVPRPQIKKGESIDDFRRRLESYLYLLDEQVELAWTLAYGEFGSLISEIKISEEDSECVKKIEDYPKILQVLERYSKNGVLDILHLLQDQSKIPTWNNWLRGYDLYVNKQKFKKGDVESQTKLVYLYLNYFDAKESISFLEKLQSTNPGDGSTNFLLSQEYRYLEDGNNYEEKIWEHKKKAIMLGNEEALLELLIDIKTNKVDDYNFDKEKKLLKEIFDKNIDLFIDVNLIKNDPEKYVNNIKNAYHIMNDLKLDNSYKIYFVDALTVGVASFDELLNKDSHKELSFAYSILSEVQDNLGQYKEAVLDYSIAYMSQFNIYTPDYIVKYFLDDKTKKEVSPLVYQIRDDLMKRIMDSKSFKTKLQSLKYYYDFCRRTELKDYPQDFFRVLDEIKNSFYYRKDNLFKYDVDDLIRNTNSIRKS